MKPKKLSLTKRGELKIVWDDKTESKISVEMLRRNCPCAVCISERIEQGNSYFPVFILDQLQVKSINAVGNYALSIIWNDGHDSGIYEFDFLKSISELDINK